jgi:5'-3' exonuclease
MILLDNNQLVIASLFHAVKSENGLTEDLVRHLVLNMYRMYRKRFSAEFGEIIICNDGREYWRKNSFPQYKANRKKQRKSSSVDWSEFYGIMNVIQDEVIKTFPYKNLQINDAEADDIIAIISKHNHNNEKILIVSSDKDFQQLQRYENVYQYSPIIKDFLICEDPENFLLEHIIKGDSSDGIPNILSDDDVFVEENKRQKPCGKKKINTIKGELSEWTNSDNWNRNQRMIDMNMIPEEVESSILEEYAKEPIGKRSNMLDYFIQKNLKNLMGSIEEF